MAACSPKISGYSMPVVSAWETIQCLCTSARIQHAFADLNDTIYFIPYRHDMNQHHEVRVFVYKGRVTAVSQYACETAGWFGQMSDDSLTTVAKNIIEFVKSMLVKITIDTMVVDLLILEDKSPVLVELNSFGYWLATGSCCFNWTADRAQLYGRKGDKVWFKVVV